MEKTKEMQPRCLGVQRLTSSPQRRSPRCLSRNPVAAYLDLYMLLTKREAFERRNDGAAGPGHQEQLRDVMQRVKQLEASRPELKQMRELIETGEKGTTVANEVCLPKGKKKPLKVIDLGY